MLKYRRGWRAALRPQRHDAGFGVARGFDLADDAAVAQLDGAVAVGGGEGAVSDQDHGEVAVGVEAAQEVEDRLPGARIEVAGGLVGDQHFRLGDQGAGDGDALLLAAGELGLEGTWRNQGNFESPNFRVE